MKGRTRKESNISDIEPEIEFSILDKQYVDRASVYVWKQKNRSSLHNNNINFGPNLSVHKLTVLT